jgi:Domain of unknown function (DUF4939)
MTTTGRSTRSTSKQGIADTLREMSQDLAGASALSTNPARPSPQPSITHHNVNQAVPIEADPDNQSHHSHQSLHSDQDRNQDQDLGGDDAPEGEEDDDEASPPERNLARSLELLASNIKGMSKSPTTRKTAVKPRVPDTFDGTDPAKLDNFIFQCSMYIATCANDFKEDDSRVTFVISYLKGTPLDWFQTELNDALTRGGTFPSWFSSYAAFLVELKRLFGPRDPVADAITALESLRYKDSTKATRFTLEFNRHSRRTGFNDQALLRQYYKVLPDRLKDEIARVGKPTLLLDLQDLVATIDQRYWERQSEMNRDKKNANPQPNKSSDKKSDDKQSDNRHGNTQGKGDSQQQSKKQDKKPATNPTSSNAKPGNKSTTIADVLGPDGKLKPEERQRRLDNKLCLRCGETGHVVADCPRTSNPKKGRAVKATTAPAASSAQGKA